jgi:hypothetical protein
VVYHEGQRAHDFDVQRVRRCVEVAQRNQGAAALRCAEQQPDERHESEPVNEPTGARPRANPKSSA